tara:strand:- start:16284 stop:17159 length:876 start_codon:yes stop_codon:yes gene_type:complete
MRSVLLTLGIIFIYGCGLGSDNERSSRILIENKGSDTIVNVAQAWAEAYSEIVPNVAVAVTGGGSGTGISSMINGTVDIANSSRKMRDSELESARERGVDPIEFIVGYDALAVFLHSDNPIEELSIAQLADIYGENGTIDTWDELGITVPGCPSNEIARVSRQNNSGTYAYFRETVLVDKEYKLGSRDMHGSKDVVDLVENTPCAIGYSGLAYSTEHVKMVCVSTYVGECVLPSVPTAVDGSYPIARPLFMYTAGQPEGVIADYMNWILGEVGQCIIVGKGYAPSQAVKCV